MLDTRCTPDGSVSEMAKNIRRKPRYQAPHGLSPIEHTDAPQVTLFVGDRFRDKFSHDAELYEVVEIVSPNIVMARRVVLMPAPGGLKCAKSGAREMFRVSQVTRVDITGAPADCQYTTPQKGRKLIRRLGESLFDRS